jgi:hypothetical protein
LTKQDLNLDLLVYRPSAGLVGDESSEDYGSVHNSGSDIEEEYFRNNPLDSASEAEDNPYLHESEDSDNLENG